MYNILLQIGGFIALILTALGIGFFRGKSSEKNKQIKRQVDDARESKKRKVNRRNSSIDDVKRRMQKFIRR